MADLHPNQVTDDLTISSFGCDLSIFAAPGVVVATASDSTDAVSIHLTPDQAYQHVRHMLHMIMEARRLDAAAGRAVVATGDMICVDIPAPAANVVAFVPKIMAGVARSVDLGRAG